MRCYRILRFRDHIFDICIAKDLSPRDAETDAVGVIIYTSYTDYVSILHIIKNIEFRAFLCKSTKFISKKFTEMPWHFHVESNIAAHAWYVLVLFKNADIALLFCTFCVLLE